VAAQSNETPSLSAWPRVVPAHRATEIVVEPTDGAARLPEGTGFRFRLTPMEHYALVDGHAASVTVPARPSGAGLTARLPFGREQEHELLVERLVDDARKNTPTASAANAPSAPVKNAPSAPVKNAPSAPAWERIGRCSIYALAPDLFSRRPWRGDLHMHSSRSDGREPPAHVAAACRRIGLDFMAVTDHHLYAPSREAQDAFAGLPVDLRIFRGEEVHPPGNPVHIINFGGSESVNDMFVQPGYAEDIDALARGFGPVAPGADVRMCAEAAWCFDRIRAVGGLGIYCHPWWVFEGRYHIPQPYVQWLFDARPWDAYEVIGGYHRHELESNLLQVAHYHEERARGRTVPIVGVSDAHGCERGELFGWYSTVVLAEDCTLAGLIAGIKDLYSLAVEAVPGSVPRAHGPLRLTRYGQFLLREVFPAHDALCAREGEAMIRHVQGDAAAAADLAAMSGQAQRLYDRMWAVGAASRAAARGKQARPGRARGKGPAA
jgi:hypothetical protein